MKKISLKFLPLLILVFVALGCSAINQLKKKVEETQQPKTMRCTDGKCELTVPGGWSEQKDLNDVANFQAGNLIADQYAIVISESKADFTDEMTLDGYVDLIRGDINSKITDAVVSDIKTIIVNGYPARQFEVTGSVDKIKARWIYTFIDAPKNFHQILAWTTASKYDSNKAVFNDVINSFKETDGVVTAPPSVSANKN